MFNFVDLLGADVAFIVVSSIAIVAFVVMAVITIIWALRIDRAGRREWLERRRSPAQRANGQAPKSNGRRPPGGPSPSGTR